MAGSPEHVVVKSPQPPRFSEPPQGEDHGPASRHRAAREDDAAKAPGNAAMPANQKPANPRDVIGYAELHCLSDFSFQRGASSARELFERAGKLGYDALAISDECSLAGIVRAWEASKKTGVPLIVGSEFRLDDGPTLVLLVEDQGGYSELCRLITLARRRCAKGTYRIERSDLEYLGAGLLVLWVPDAAWLPSRQPRPPRLQVIASALAATGSSRVVPLRRVPSQAPPSMRAGNAATEMTPGDEIVDAPAIADRTVTDESATSQSPDLRQTARWVAQHFTGRAWIAVELHRGPDDDADLQALQSLGARYGLPLVAAGGVHMHERRRRALHDAMTAMRMGCAVSEAGHALCANGERHLRGVRALAAIYPLSLREETRRIAARCLFQLDRINYAYPRELVPHGVAAHAHLAALARQGARKHWPRGIPQDVAAMLEMELALIAKCKYEHFFLTVAEIVAWARAQSPPILCQGRGSAANSAVCFCLDITSVNPEGGNLRFERFISEERDEPPDIDVDFEHERREEVLQHVFEKYGRERAALAATVITWQPKSAVRALAAALGLGQDQQDELSRLFARGNGGVAMDVLLREHGFDPADRTIRQVLTLAGELVDMPRHLSQHVGGFVISEHPLHTLVPVENAAMDARTIIQWDKDDLESLKLLKVDCLALGMLTCLRKCFELLRQHGIADLTLSTVPVDDAATYAMIGRADTVGVFQIESRAQMSMLPRLKPRCFYDLVIEVAIVRPGPIQGGMVHPYLRRRLGEEPVDLRAELEPVLGRTLGVPLFQEQVMHLLQVAASFTPGESDHLRRSMAAWKRHGGLEHFEQRIHAGMAANNYSAEYAARIFEQIKGFGSYGFPESHATAFAQLAWVSSWLKCHHPAAFACALLNSQPMGFYSPAQIVQDLRRHAVVVLPVDITSSDWDSTLEPARDGTLVLRLGLRLVNGLAEATARRIVDARHVRAFDGVADLAQRAQLPRNERERLASAGALRRLAGHRHRAHWDSAGAELATPLLRDARTPEARVVLAPPTLREDVLHDLVGQGFSLECHPVALVRAQLRARRVRDSRELATLAAGSSARGAGLVTVRQGPPTAHGTVFVTLEDEHGPVNVIVWQRVAQQYRRVLIESVLLGVDGEVQAQGDVRHLVARRLVDYSALLPELATQSRDFH